MNSTIREPMNIRQNAINIASPIKNPEPAQTFPKESPEEKKRMKIMFIILLLGCIGLIIWCISIILSNDDALKRFMAWFSGALLLGLSGIIGYNILFYNTIY